MKCPYCDSPLPPDAVHCPACGAQTGAPLRQEPAAKSANSDEVAAELKKLKKERKKLKRLREELEEEEYDDDEEYDDEEEDEEEDEPSPLNKWAHIAGWILIGVGIADFAGMFLGYDFTGYPWTPLVFGVVGEILINLDL